MIVATPTPVVPSLLQELDLVLHAQGATPPTYLLQWRIHGEVAPDRLQSSLDALVQRHDALRMRFHGQRCDVVDASDATCPFEVLDVSDREDERRKIRAVLDSLDRERGPLVSARLLRSACGSSQLVIVTDLIVCDWISSAILSEELGSLYRCALDGSPSSLAAAPSFVGYARAERAWFESPEGQASIAYWADVFRARDGMLPELRLRRSADEAKAPATVMTAAFDAVAADALREVARRLRVTAGTLVLGALLTVLRRRSETDAVGVRLPLPGRHWPGASDVGAGTVVGYLGHNVPLWVDVPESACTREILPAVQRAMFAAMEHPLSYVAYRDQHHAGAAPEPVGALAGLAVTHVAFIGNLSLPTGELRLPGASVERLHDSSLFAPERTAVLSVEARATPSGMSLEIRHGADVHPAGLATGILEDIRSDLNEVTSGALVSADVDLSAGR